MTRSLLAETAPATPEQRSALASPLRLEIIGLFTGPDPLSIADMASRMGRTPGSLYHHVGILEQAGLLRRAGTRPKGKRHEALFSLVAMPTLEVDPGDEESRAQLLKSWAAAFRMGERDLEAALSRNDLSTEGPGRNLLAIHIHMRIDRETLTRLNEHLDAILRLLSEEPEPESEPSGDDQLLSLTLALLPLRGRAAAIPNDPTKGDS